MNKPKILVVMKTDEEQKARFRADAGDADLLFLPASEVTDELLGTADAVIGNLSPKRIRTSISPAASLIC